MSTRGEKQYIRMPAFAASLYDNLTRVKGVNQTFEEIAVFISNRLDQGKILDIGTGPGRLLLEISKKNPDLELFGLDISAGMLAVAGQNLQGVQHVDLQVGNISHSGYSDNFFDSVLSTGSFYNWDDPVAGLNEIFRILKPGRTACIFESYKGFDQQLLKARLRSNLKGYNPVRRWLSKYFLYKQLRMTYTEEEFEALLKQSAFRAHFKMVPLEMGNLPIYVRLDLVKPAVVSSK